MASYDRDGAVALKNDGNGFFKARQFPQAIEKYKQAVAKDPTYHVPYSNRSQAYYNLGQYKEAAEDGALCMKYKPDFVKGYHRRANALLAMNDIENCFKTLELAYRVVGRGNADLARIDEQVRPKYEALVKAKNANLQGPEKFKALGNEQFKASNYEGAINFYKKAISSCGQPGSPSFDKEIYVKCHNNMALCYKQQSDFKKVAECCTLVLEIEQYDLKALFNRANAFEGLEKYSLALEDIRKCLYKNPNWPAANQAQNRLNRNVRMKKNLKKGGR